MGLVQVKTEAPHAHAYVGYGKPTVPHEPRVQGEVSIPFRYGEKI